jgi:hypothetical protein
MNMDRIKVDVDVWTAGPGGSLPYDALRLEKKTMRVVLIPRYAVQIGNRFGYFFFVFFLVARTIIALQMNDIMLDKWTMILRIKGNGNEPP